MAESMEAKFRARIAKIAKGEVGQTACSRKTAGKPGYFTSCHRGAAVGPPEFWCADFVRWVWWKAGAINTAPGTDILTAAAVSFVKYGKLRSRPRVGDAVLFGYNDDPHDPTAAHVGIVVQVNANTILSVSGDIGGHGKSQGDFAATSRVVPDNPYNSKVHTSDPNAPNSPLSGYISPVEDVMPFTKKQIVQMVQDGVAAAVKPGGEAHGEIRRLVKQGVEAELTAALTGISTQLGNLQTQIAKLTPATSPPTGTNPSTGTDPGNGTDPGTGTGPGTATGRETGTGAGTGTSGSPGTGQPS